MSSAAAGQPLAVGVEQVGGAVQGDGGLAGARAALDDQHAAGVGADDPVLLGLDGADDVGHPAGAGGVQRGQQHRLAGQAGPLRDVRIVEVEGLVGDADDGAPAGADVPAAADAEVVQRGRGVEGLGGRGAPVDQQRLLVAVLGLQPDPADVARGRRRRGGRAGRSRARSRRRRGRPAARCRAARSPRARRRPAGCARRWPGRRRAGRRRWARMSSSRRCRPVT